MPVGRALWLVSASMIAVFLFGCGKARSEEAIGSTRYEFSNAQLVSWNASGNHSVGDCGFPDGPWDVNFVAEVTQEENSPFLRIRDVNNGCSLRGELRGDSIVADGAECDLDPDGALVAVGGLSRTYPLFRIDRATGAFQASLKSVHSTNTGIVDSCGVANGRRVIDGLLRYRGKRVATNELEGTDVACRGQINSNVSGYLQLDEGPEGRVSLFDTGEGCRIELSSVDGVSFRAEDTTCTFEGELGLGVFGVVEKRYEVYSLNRATGSIEAQGRLVRNTSSGLKTSCFEFVGSLGD
jgi:hypothetical protein